MTTLLQVVFVLSVAYIAYVFTEIVRKGWLLFRIYQHVKAAEEYGLHLMAYHTVLRERRVGVGESAAMRLKMKQFDQAFRRHSEMAEHFGRQYRAINLFPARRNRGERAHERRGADLTATTTTERDR